MSMLDALFNKGFRGAKCKTLLKLTIPRIKLLRNRREVHMKQMRKEIAKLLETGQEATARIRVEHIIREQKTMDAYEIIELFCELIAVRLPIIETQRECPLDLKEAISSLCFAGPRCSDLPELLQVQLLFAAKYGKEFVTAATELMPDCGVNRQIIELLSVRAPLVEEKLRLLKEIAEEHELDWDPTASEAEFLKPHEDLLNGPSQFTDGSKLPLPNEKHDESFYSGSVSDSYVKLDSETSFDILDLPEAPQGSLRSNYETKIPPPSAPPHDSVINSAREGKVVSHEIPLHPREDVSGASAYQTSPDSSVSSQDEMPLRPESDPTILDTPSYAEMDGSVGGICRKPVNHDDVNFGTPSNLSPDSMVGRKEEVTLDSSGVKFDSPACVATKKSSLDTEKSQHLDEKDSVPGFYVATDTSVVQEEKQFFPFNPPATSCLSPNQRTPSILRTKTEITADLQDVMAATRQAAEAAESAAAAARSAATLAQIRISELCVKGNDDLIDSTSKGIAEEKELHNTLSDEFEKQVNSDNEPSYPLGPQTERQTKGSETLIYPSYGTSRLEKESSNIDDDDDDDGVRYLRSTSMEDDPFSYPNLFSSQSSYNCPGDSPTHKHAHGP